MDRVFDSNDVLGALDAHYPLSPARFAHQLATHPLLSLERLAEASLALPPSDVERRVANQGVGARFVMLEQQPLPIDAHIRTIAENPCWIMLAQIQKIPEYQALIEQVMAEVLPIVEPKTGVCKTPVGFIFISARGSTTPFHFDPEYNLFFQIAGSKQFATFPCAPPFMTDAVQERYHFDGDNLLAWDDDLADRATVHNLQPGDALFVPYKAPHWVKVEDGLSISLSITWKSDWCFTQEYGHRFNARLRHWGLNPRPLSPWPATASAKALGGRLLDRLGPPA